MVYDQGLAGRGRQKPLGGRPCIFLRPDDRPERLQWAAAHELGETVAWQVFEAVGGAEWAASRDELPPLREQVASELASRILLPGEWFRAACRECDTDLPELKQQFSTASHELIAWRLLDLPVPSTVAIFDEGQATRRRSNFSRGRLPVEPAELGCRDEAARTGRKCVVQTPRVMVTAWPVHEENWRREILRLVYHPRDDDDFA